MKTAAIADQSDPREPLITDQVFAAPHTDIPRQGLRVLLLAGLIVLVVDPLIGFGDPQLADTPELRWNQWVTTLLSLPLFTFLYVAAWAAVEWRRPSIAFALCVVMALLGFALIRWNLGGVVFVLYATCFAPYLFSPARAFLYVAALIAEALVLAPPGISAWHQILHTLSIMIVGVAAVLYTVHRRLALVATDPAAEHSNEVAARTGAPEVRASMDGYRRLGVAGELRSGARVLESAGVRLETAIANVSLPPRVEGVFALALREVLSSVARYAGATTCRVALFRDGDAFTLMMNDDGIGNSVLARLRLPWMRDRVKAIGGTMTVAAGPGISVTISVPAPRSSPDQPPLT